MNAESFKFHRSVNFIFILSAKVLEQPTLRIYKNILLRFQKVRIFEEFCVHLIVLCYLRLRILTGKQHPHKKFKRLRKI